MRERLVSDDPPEPVEATDDVPLPYNFVLILRRHWRRRVCRRRRLRGLICVLLLLLLLLLFLLFPLLFLLLFPLLLLRLISSSSLWRQSRLRGRALPERLDPGIEVVDLGFGAQSLQRVVVLLRVGRSDQKSQALQRALCVCSGVIVVLRRLLLLPLLRLLLGH
ncbi:hypothetical protein HDK90DRAFT_288756 [Phyllosticta capitalensis]|uniref:Transmembrane protein n=1 Tax=Phyllosticta capitalensis TaxID=121624 RepID=A0ABR1YNK8_9PEZI